MPVKKVNKTRRIDISNVRAHIVGQDTKVPILSGVTLPYIYFDNAASTPVFEEILTCVNDFMPWYSSVHRGTGLKSQVSTRAFENAREAVGKFFGANKDEHVVIFGKNATEALNKLSYRLDLTKHDVVLVSLMEHHSNDLPWRKTSAHVERIGVDTDGRLLEHELDSLLEKFGKRVRLVAISGASNVTGFVPDIHGIAKKAHAVGAQILVDCAQLAPHRAVDIKSLDDPSHLDYIAVSAHKMYAPFGTGVLIGRRETFEKGVPEFCGGGTIDVVTTDKVEWTAPPDRDEAGTPNVVGAVAFAKSLEVLSRVSMDEIALHEARLTKYALEKLNKISGVTIYGSSDPDESNLRLGVIPFKINDLPSGLIASILSSEWGIGVRSGCFCAHPYVVKLLGMPGSKIEEFRHEVMRGDRSHMPGVVRVSFGIYNDEQEIDRLAEAVSEIAAGNYNPNYRQEKRTGDFYPVGWEPNLDNLFSI